MVRGGKTYRRGGGGGKKRGPPKNGGYRKEEEEEEEEGGGTGETHGQNPRMGQMPTSSSSSEEEEEEEERGDPRKGVPSRDVAAYPGQLPPSDTESEGDLPEEEEEEKEKTAPVLPPKRKVKGKEDTASELNRSRGLMKKEMERLKLIREEREKQAKERIEKDGFDRYAPAEKGGRPNLL